jgi:hypothetical protein
MMINGQNGSMDLCTNHLIMAYCPNPSCTSPQTSQFTKNYAREQNCEGGGLLGAFCPIRNIAFYVVANANMWNGIAQMPHFNISASLSRRITSRVAKEYRGRKSMGGLNGCSRLG